MEIAAFLSIVLICVLLGLWLAHRKPRKPTAAELKKKLDAYNDRADKLSTPPSYLLSRPDHLWQKRQQDVEPDVTPTNRFAPKSRSSGVPEYDGYSRRDRQHVVVGTAHIKKDRDADDAPLADSKPREGRGSK
jgi:hypothetical protein